ncbi:hypothetical protein [Arcanobacterium haemolyticum]
MNRSFFTFRPIAQAKRLGLLDGVVQVSRSDEILASSAGLDVEVFDYLLQSTLFRPWRAHIVIRAVRQE